MNLSIIIPIYNVEKYLAKCLDSVLETSWEGITFEIIIIDDESPDGSLKIAKEFEKKHPTIKIISQKNKGLGGARNTGLENAQGIYVFFLDSDDFLIKNNLPSLAQKALENKVDIMEFSAITVDENYAEIKNIFPVEEISKISGESYFSKKNPSNSVCNKLYRREFLLQNNIRFIERVYVEDAPFNVEAYLKADGVGSFPLVPVAFLQNSSSITRKKRTGEQMSKFINDSIIVTNRIASFLDDPMISYNAKEALQRKLGFFVSGILLMILKSEQPFSQKQKYIADLESSMLYPMNYNSGSWLRNSFLFFANKKVLYRLMHLLFNLKRG